jgi:hypothetical protein
MTLTLLLRPEHDDSLMHVLSAVLAVFLFYSVVFAANLLGIPFYLGYKRFTMEITVLSAEADGFFGPLPWLFRFFCCGEILG